MKIVACDVETTGLVDIKEPGNDLLYHDIIQLAFLYIENMEIVNRATFLMAPFKIENVDPEALRVHGHTTEQIKEYENPQSAHIRITRFLESHINKYDPSDKAYFLAFKGSFDLSFVNDHFKKCKDSYLGSFINWKILDPLSMIHYLQFTGSLPILENCKLSTWCEHFGITLKAHDAESDIEATFELFKKVSLLMTGVTNPVIISEAMKILKTTGLPSGVYSLIKMILREYGSEKYPKIESSFLDSMSKKFLRV